jgi:hypothetical protein
MVASLTWFVHNGILPMGMAVSTAFEVAPLFALMCSLIVVYDTVGEGGSEP